MDEDKLETAEYLDRQKFSEQEVNNLHQGKQDYKESEE